MEYLSTMQTVAWFKARYLDGSLTIQPPYQRKPVWGERQKCYLIESIAMGLPIPEIYVHQETSPEGETTYAIVDGQQRIRTILQFIGSDETPSEEEYIKFPLSKLLPESPWYNLTFAEMTDLVKTQFYGYNLVVRFLKTNEEGEVRDMFRRLNKFLTPLKPQELRNATYSGPFVTLVETLADDTYWSENRIVTPITIRRMGDLEFISELAIGVLHGPQDGKSDVIDSYYKQYEDYEDEFPEQGRVRKLFSRTLETVKVLLPQVKETRWCNRSDFYSLFIALAAQLREGDLLNAQIPRLRRVLLEFGKDVDARLSDETPPATQPVIGYARAVEKGPNSKARRAARHLELLKLMRPHFKSKRT